MPTLSELRDANRAACARMDAVMEANRGRSMSDADQQSFDDASAEAERTAAEIDAIEKVGRGRDARAITARADPAGMDNMRQQIRAAGMTPRDDPGGGLPLAQASMARTLAAQGIEPNLPARS